MMGGKAVFFDLDGTLLDTSEDLGGALNALLKDEGRPALSMNTIRGHVSNGANALVTLGFGEQPEADRQRLRRQLLAHYTRAIAVHTRPFPGIEPLLARLAEQGIQWGIVTNKPRVYTLQLLERLEFAHPPVCVVSPEDAGVGKPDPAPLHLACELASVAAADCLYVGDHLRDIECGINAQMPTIAVGYGFISDPTAYLHWNATYAVANADEIWPVVARHFGCS